jgi:hypothetical protein
VIERAARTCREYPDYRAFHSLYFLSKVSAREFGKLSSERIAAILFSAFKRRVDLSDFGLLRNEPVLGPAGELLIGCQPGDILPELIRLIDDHSMVRLDGSERATASIMYDYRKHDYAYWLLCLAINMEYKFETTPVERARIITENMPRIQQRVADILKRR